VGRSKQDILVHACCAPCCTYVFDALSAGHTITALFYNPNIQPSAEYEKRLGDMKRVCLLKRVRIIIPDYDPQPWRETTKGMEGEPEGGLRCTECFRLRLEKTAAEAVRLGINMFTTTLTVSPHKNARIINETGAAVAVTSGLTFMEHNFKKKNGYKISCEQSRSFNLYRQQYCGCFYSMKARG